MQTLYEETGKTFLTTATDEDSSVSWATSTDYFRTGQHNIEGRLKVRDCYKVVSIEFFCGSEKEYKQKLDKLDTLINELYKFRNSLTTAWDYKKESELWLKQS